MLKSHLILALRNLMKRKLYSFINIFGLAIGVAVCLVILKYVDFELSFDSFHKNAANIYRTTTTYYQNGDLRGTGVISAYAQGPSLLADVPEVSRYIRTHPMYGGAVLSYAGGSADERIFHEDNNIQFVDSTFLDVFTYSAIAGDLNTALDGPNSIVMSRTMAAKYFGEDAAALGKIVKVSGGWADGDYEVTAVIEDVPQNSHFTFDFLFPIHNLLKGQQYQQDDGWGWNNFVTYIELHPSSDLNAVHEKLPAFIEKYRGKDLAEQNGKVVLKLQPIRDIHLSPGLDYESSATVSTGTIYFFVIISIFILSIAWVNYINLSTARAMERAREVGIKKSVGALKTQLISQFIFESVLVNFLGVVLAVLLAIALLPVLGEIVNKELVFDFSDPRLWLVIAGLFVTGSFISGLYPAFVLSSFKITTVLKGSTEKVSGFSLRKALVIFQFCSSLVLIAGTFAIYRQVVFMRDQDKGLTMEQMLVVNGPSVLQRENAKARLISLKDELRQIPGVLNVTTSSNIPGGGHSWGTGMRKDGMPLDANKDGRVVWIDPDFIETYGITVLSGRNFDPTITSDMESVLVNEASLKSFGLGDPQNALTERIILGGDTVAILGVVKNYHWTSLKTEHEAWLFKADTIARRNFSVHLSGNNMSETIANVEAKYKEFFPGNPFDYYFLDDFFNSQYKAEQQFARIFGLFAILAILIACLGLWGLASFTTTQKLKEIGIRKVLGASVSSLMSMLSWQFLKLVLIATAIAIPLSWYGIDSWLSNFAFRIGMEWDLFVIPVVILAVIALGTVSIQIFRGANVNPAKILRTE